MEFPLEIAFEQVAQSDQLEICIHAEAAKLAEFASRISSARVVIGRPQRRNHIVNACRVSIHIARPDGPDVVITRDPAVTGAQEDVQTTIRDAFKALRRRLIELSEPT
jgi:hypothetical protein